MAWWHVFFMIGFRNIGIQILIRSGINTLYQRSFLRRGLILLGYHSIVEKSGTQQFRANTYSHLSISRDRFEEHIIYLKKHRYEFLSLEDLADIRDGKRQMPLRAVNIYFDDGFHDNLAHAYPILKKYKVPATLFVATDLIDQKKTLWEDVLVAAGDGRIFLTWDELNNMKDMVSIGSHSVSHPKMTNVQSDALKYEFRASRERIEQQLHMPVYAFSYPYGRSNSDTRAYLIECGYTMAVTTLYGANTSNFDWLRMRKISMKANDSFSMFRLKLGLYYPIKNILEKFL